MENTTEPENALARAIHELAAVIRQGNEQKAKTKMTVMTPSTGGEIVLEWDPNGSKEEFTKYLNVQMERREESLKALLKLNMDLGIGVKADKGAQK